ncbi:hypothetical protein SUGI_0536510 [Cryptomeria japonica]|nr:hypothetical protein SUGI_0536510 [Cryptomeria japonica]
MEDESAGEDEGDGDINRLTANINIHGSEDEITMAEYEMHRTHKKFVVRQLPSKGLSFQVWPAASALCWFLDEMYWHHPTIVTAADENTRISSCIGQDVGSINGGEQNLSAEGYCELDYVARLLLQRRDDKQAFKVLELGAGTGMVGIAAALLGAHVTITDLPHVLPNIEFNASVNEEPLQASKQGGSVCVKALRWGEEEDVVEVGHNFDLILASDVVYHENLFDPLLLTLKWLLLGNGRKIAIQYYSWLISGGGRRMPVSLRRQINCLMFGLCTDTLPCLDPVWE